MLSQDEVQQFDRWGLIRLPAAICAEDVAAMRERIWSFLRERNGIERADAGSWPVGSVAQFQRLARSGELDPIGTSTAVSAALDDLFGSDKWQAGPTGVLVTFPQPDVVWTVPTSSWHLDAPPQGLGKVVAVRVFVILDDLAVQGGGTLVLAGSHRLVRNYLATSGPNPRSRDIKSRLGSAHPWMARLWGSAIPSDADRSPRNRQYLDEGAVVDDVPVVVKELHGASGDVFLMHMDCFHASAPNCRTQPRLMLASSGTRS